MVYNPQPKWNAKARQSTAGGRKKGKLKRKRSEVDDDNEDSNALMHTPATKEEKEDSRRERMKAELIAQAESKWTNKKKKRLEKYIDKKLKKEERVHILEKLACVPILIIIRIGAEYDPGRARLKWTL
jgi:ATP-dependent RNA helicase DHX37/DHR1